MSTPPCRVCKKVDDAIQYPDENPALTICPTCCEKAEHPDGETGHVWEYDRYERSDVCVHCGICKRDTDYDRSD